MLRHLPLRSATALVVANIIGAGIFTTTGFQAQDLGHPGWIYLLWAVGGVLALAGALCYAELGAAMPEAGAEYVYLRRTYGPALGFMSAFVSLIAGFSAPIAAAAKSLVRYARPFVPLLGDESAKLGPVSIEDVAAMAVVWLLVAVHLRGHRGGFGFNDAMTLLKVLGITGIVVAAFAIGRGELARMVEVSPRFAGVVESHQLVPALATSLIFVMFCYSGWNASAYVASEMRDPQRDLPRSLLLGTALVVVLYLALNAVSCVIVLRWRRPDLERPFHVWGYPVTPLLFLAVSAWMMVWAFRGRPVESTLSLVTVAIGGLVFLLLGAGRGRS